MITAVLGEHGLYVFSLTFWQDSPLMQKAGRIAEDEAWTMEGGTGQ